MCCNISTEHTRATSNASVRTCHRGQVYERIGVPSAPSDDNREDSSIIHARIGSQAVVTAPQSIRIIVVLTLRAKPPANSPRMRPVHGLLSTKHTHVVLTRPGRAERCNVANIVLTGTEERPRGVGRGLSSLRHGCGSSLGGAGRCHGFTGLKELRFGGVSIIYCLRFSSRFTRFRTVSSNSRIIHRMLTTTVDNRFVNESIDGAPAADTRHDPMYEAVRYCLYLVPSERLKAYAQD